MDKQVHIGELRGNTILSFSDYLTALDGQNQIRMFTLSNRLRIYELFLLVVQLFIQYVQDVLTHFPL